MVKPLKEYDFRQIGGLWRDIKSNEQRILSDVLDEYQIVVDDRAEFVRLRDCERGVVIIYRVVWGKITITIWKIHG